MKIDLSVAFDSNPYLIPQLYLYFYTLRDNLPKDWNIHMITEKSTNDVNNIWWDLHDYEVGDFVSLKTLENVKSKLSDGLKSRCRYLLNAVDIKPYGDWVVRTDLDFLWINKLDKLESLLDGCDIVIQPENRRIIDDDNIELRLWKQIYRAMDIDVPKDKIRFIEDGRYGLPLYNTGFFMIKSELLSVLKERWNKLTGVCEKWIDWNIHPNEFAMSAIIQDEGWKVKELPTWANFNPISMFRKGEFPSQQLVDNPIISSDVIGLHYHKPFWLKHLAKYNTSVQKIINSIKLNIPDDWWNLPLETYMEK